MKLYKRFAFAIITIFLLLSMCGCIIIPLSKYYDISAEDVTSVQFYDLRNAETAEYYGFYKDYEPVYTLPEEENADFLNDFAKLEFTDTIVIVLAAIDPSLTYGDWVVRINFSNGEYTFYSCGGYGETFDAEGNCIDTTFFSCDVAELETLIGKYYDIE